MGHDPFVRDPAGWPKGDFTYTHENVVHIVTQWWDDDIGEIRTLCRKYFKDEPEVGKKPITCFLCLADGVDADAFMMGFMDGLRKAGP